MPCQTMKKRPKMNTPGDTCTMSLLLSLQKEELIHLTEACMEITTLKEPNTTLRDSLKKANHHISALAFDVKELHNEVQAIQNAQQTPKVAMPSHNSEILPQQVRKATAQTNVPHLAPETKEIHPQILC
ncbi:hypothetical protein IWQ61_008697 [Dispira simplex]|nr:hypothetical protein IWQ61_008697 [Dispira simplex]